MPLVGRRVGKALPTVEVADVPPAACAHQLATRAVAALVHRVALAVPERRPAAAAVELGGGVVERGVAAGAEVPPLRAVVVEAAELNRQALRIRAACDPASKDLLSVSRR